MKSTAGSATLLIAALSRHPLSPARRPVPPARPTYRSATRDRVYAAEQFSNTVSVTDLSDNRLLGVIRLGDPQPGNFSPLYRGQVLVHGMGFSPDHKTLAVVSIGSNSVSFIDTATNGVKHMTYVGRSPHEAFFTPDGKDVWVTVRGEDYVAVLDGRSFGEKPASPRPWTGHADFLAGRDIWLCLLLLHSPNRGHHVADHKIVGKVAAGKPLLSRYRRHPGRQAGMVHSQGYRQDPDLQRPSPLRIAETLDTGPITNHVNFVRTPRAILPMSPSAA